MTKNLTKKLMLAAGAVALLFAGLPAAQAQSARDQAYCEDYAYQTAWRNNNGDAIGQGAVTGAVAGGVLGAILGHGKGKNIVGGAIAGTATGALLGSTSSRGGYVDRRTYRVAYANCMDDRAARYRRPVRVYRDNVSQDDIDYCMARYRSYNPRTGLYRTYSGGLRPCP